MTVCIGVIDETGCAIVADGLGVASGMERHAVRKIFSHLGLTFAMSGYTTARYVMESSIEVEMTRNAAGAVSLAGLSNALRENLANREWLTDGDRGGNPPYWDMAYILTDGYSLATVLTDMSAEFCEDSMTCIGSGIEMTIGVYHYAVQMGESMQGAALSAVTMSARYLHSCGGEVHSGFRSRDKRILVP